MARRLSKILNWRKKPKVEDHGPIVKIEVSFKYKYVQIIAKDNYTITVTDKEFDILVETIEKAKNKFRK